MITRQQIKSLLDVIEADLIAAHGDADLAAVRHVADEILETYFTLLPERAHLRSAMCERLLASLSAADLLDRENIGLKVLRRAGVCIGAAGHS